ncbi:MAG: lysylphosphatidylglycerol synthase domain-containing protein [Bacteroidota bacterium]
MVKTITRLLLYASLIFFGWYLYRLDYLVLEDVQIRIPWFLASLVFLFTGFILSSISWGYALKVHGYRIPALYAVFSHGLPVFAKYIPGKIWVILGRASYVASQKIPLKIASMVSLKEQLIYLTWGLLISILPVFLFTGNTWFGLLILLSAAGIIIVLFSPLFHRLLLNILARILKRPVDIPLINIADALKVSRVVVLYWICWTIAFYLLLISVFPQESALLMAFAFPVSVTYGVLAIFMPGGIGVREGILTAFLTAGGMPLENAVTLSILSRLWFVAGEIFMFFTAFAVKISGKVSGYPEYPSTWQKAKPGNR